MDLYGLVFDEVSGDIRPECLAVLAVLVITVLFVAADGPSLIAGASRGTGTELSDAGDAGAHASAGAEAEEHDGDNLPDLADVDGDEASARAPKLSMKELQALSKRRRAAKEKEPESPLFWRSLRAKRRAVTAAALSAGSGKRGPSWAAIAEQDLTVRAWRLSRDGAGTVEYALTGQAPAKCGEITGLAIAGALVSPPSAIAGKSAKRAGGGGSAKIVAVTQGSGRFVVVWVLGEAAGDLGAPAALLDVSVAHPGRIGRLLAPCSPPGSPASAVALTMALHDTKDTAVTAFGVSGGGGTPARPVKAKPVGRVDVMHATNYDMALSPGRRWLGVSAHLADVPVFELHHDASDSATLAGAAMTKLTRAATLPGDRGGHAGRGAGVAFCPPGVSPFLVVPAAGEPVGPGTRLGVAPPAPPCPGRGDSSVVVAISAKGAWSAWDIGVPAGASPEIIAKGTIDARELVRAAGGASAEPGAGAVIECVRVLGGSPLRLAMVASALAGGGRALAVVALVASGERAGPATPVAGSWVPAGDAVVLEAVDLAALGPVVDVQVSDSVSDACPASHMVAGVGSDASRPGSSFQRREVAAASGWPSFLLTSHLGAASAKMWRVPAASDHVRAE